jgi:hypothetical protein
VSTRLLSRRSMRTADVRIRRHAAAFTWARGKFDVSISPFAQWTSGFHAKRSFIATIDHLTHEIRISRWSAEKPSRTLRLRGNGVRRLDCRYKTVSAYALHARRAALQKVTANVNESLASQCIIRILHCAPAMRSPFCRPSDAQRVYKPTDAAWADARACGWAYTPWLILLRPESRVAGPFLPQEATNGLELLAICTPSRTPKRSR